jgi:hypothetical protein
MKNSDNIILIIFAVFNSLILGLTHWIQNNQIHAGKLHCSELGYYAYAYHLYLLPIVIFVIIKLSIGKFSKDRIDQILYLALVPFVGFVISGIILYI